jgi:hypothetical protein
MLADLLPSLREFDQRWVLFTGDNLFLVWLSRAGSPLDYRKFVLQSEVASLATESSEIYALYVSVADGGDFVAAKGIITQKPQQIRTDYQQLRSQSEALRARITRRADALTKPKEDQGRNDLCQCGSGLKFKRCHGSPRNR